jgi:RNA polymerase sigma-70 factor, ECF subfamily
VTDSSRLPQAISEANNAESTADFPAVYREHFGWMIHSLRRLGVAQAELEDVAHDVFVAVYRHFQDLDRARPIRPWLFGFAYRVASDYRKLSRHRHETATAPGSTDEAFEPADDALPADEQLDQRRLRKRLHAALDAMEFEKRSLVVMHDLEAVPVPEIARMLGIPLNTAYSRLRLARAEFEKQLEALTRGGTHG